MRVAFIIRATAFKAPGGDTTQAKNTAKYLKDFGVEAELKLTNEEVDYSRYDLLHFFNIIRPADILRHIEKTNTPFVISPIFVNYHEFDKKHRQDVQGVLSRFFSFDSMEYIKAVARNYVNNEKIGSRSYWLKGHRRSVRYLINNCRALLPNSENEINRLFRHYKVSQRYKVVPNGIDTGIFHRNRNNSERNGVLCVGQIQGLKNQLSLIKAMEGTGLNLKIIGKPTINSQGYYEACKNAAGNNVEFIGFLEQPQLVKEYMAAKVHVLPSWFETTGLSSLEAAAMGCRVVMGNRGDAFEYFGDSAAYIDPGDIQDIRTKVLEEYNKDTDLELQEKIFEKYTWKKASEKTFEAYKMIQS